MRQDEPVNFVVSPHHFLWNIEPGSLLEMSSSHFPVPENWVYVNRQTVSNLLNNIGIDNNDRVVVERQFGELDTALCDLRTDVSGTKASALVSSSTNKRRTRMHYEIPEKLRRLGERLTIDLTALNDKYDTEEKREKTTKWVMVQDVIEKIVDFEGEVEDCRKAYDKEAEAFEKEKFGRITLAIRTVSLALAGIGFGVKLSIDIFNTATPGPGCAVPSGGQ
jgi:hypothetical protein